MEVTGRQFQDLTNVSQTRRQQALRNLKQGSSSKVISRQCDAAATGRPATVAAVRAQANLHHSADSLGSSCTDLSKDNRQRHSRRQHRRRVACIVVEQWKWFTQDRKAVSLASRHHRHRLLLSAFLALQKHAKHQQLEWRRAAIFNHRRQYMLQGRCLLLWQAQLNNSKKVQQQLAKATAVRHRKQQLMCMSCWRQFVAYKKQRRREHLQAKYYRSFVLLSSAVLQWRIATQKLAAKRIKMQSAMSLCSTRQLGAFFKSWLLGMQMQQHSQHAKQQATKHFRITVLASIMQHWHSTTADVQQAQKDGSAAMQVMHTVCT